MEDYGAKPAFMQRILVALEKSNETVLDEISQDSVALAGIAEQAVSALPDADGLVAADDYDAETPTNFAAIMKSLSGLFSNLSGDQLDAEIASAIDKLKDTVGDIQTGKLLSDSERKRATLSEKQDKIKEQQEKIDEAEKAAKKSRRFGRLAAAFSVIAAVASIVAGVIAVATGVGAAAGALMIAGGVVGMISAADSIKALKTGEGFLSPGMSKALMITGLVLAGASIMMAVGPAMAKGIMGIVLRMTTQADDAVAAGASVGTKVASQADDLVAAGSKVAAQSDDVAASGHVAAYVKDASMGVTAVSGVGTTVGAIGQSITSKDAAFLQADAQELQADQKLLEAFMQVLDDFIDILIDQISGEDSRFNQMLGEIQASMNDRGNTFAKAKFSA